MRRDVRSETLLKLLCSAAGGILLLGLILCAASQPFNYDEITEFHAAWQVSQGHAPYTDFFHDHPPYHWVLYAPLMKFLPEKFESLVFLRCLNLLFSVAGLFLLLRLVQHPFQHFWSKAAALGAVAVMASQFPVLQTLAEFRSDPLAWFLALLAVWILERPLFAENPSVRRGAAGALWGASLTLSPKLILLCALTLFFDGLREERMSLRRLAGRGGLFLGGAVAAWILLNALCAAAGIHPLLYYTIVLKYHSSLLAAAGHRFGLLISLGTLLRENVVLAAAAAAGAAGIAVSLRRQNWRRRTVLLTFSGFAVGQLLWIPYPWRQYLTVVLLAWSVPIAYFFAFLLDSRRRGAASAAIFLLLAGSLASGFFHIQKTARSNYLANNIRMGNRLLAWSPPGRPVAAQPPFHPVFRTNSTYFFTHSVNPRGPGTEKILQDDPVIGDRFTTEGILRELRENPPSLIVLHPAYAGSNYLDAMKTFLSRDGSKSYERRRSGDISIFIRTPPHDKT